MDIVLAHGGLAGFPDMDAMMLAMPVLPALFMGTVVTGTLLERRGALRGQQVMPLATALAVIAVTLSLAAAAIHLAVLEEHARRDVLFGIGFVAVGGAQLAWAAAYLARPARWLALAAIVGNLAVITTWIASRTIGLPIGPTPWLAEPISLLDLLATSYEVGIVAVLLVSLRGVTARDGSARQVRVLDTFVGAGFTIVFVSLATVLALLWTALGVLGD